MNTNVITSKRLTRSIVIIILLSICLTITTFALIWASVSVDNNLFHTGMIKINLNDGKPVIEEHEFLFEPGMTVKKDFFLENQSTWDVYYKLYLDDIDGGLADVLDISIRDKDKVLFEGKANELTKENVGAANDILKLNEKRYMSVYFHFPEDAGNDTENLRLEFTIKADAVQTKNNPNKLFE